jgi:Putative transposase
MRTIAADPKRLGVKIGFTSVLHTWGSAMSHHPHVHLIVPGGGISLDGTRWIGCRSNYLLPVKVPPGLVGFFSFHPTVLGPSPRPYLQMQRMNGPNPRSQ